MKFFFGLDKSLESSDTLNIGDLLFGNMIRGAPKYIMFAFFALGVLFIGYSLWALFLTDIPQDQFLEDPRFEEEYVQYHEWNILFGTALIGIGWIIAFVGRKMTRGSHLQTKD